MDEKTRKKLEEIKEFNKSKIKSDDLNHWSYNNIFISLVTIFLFPIFPLWNWLWIRKYKPFMVKKYFLSITIFSFIFLINYKIYISKNQDQNQEIVTNTNLENQKNIFINKINAFSIEKPAEIIIGDLSNASSKELIIHLHNKNNYTFKEDAFEIAKEIKKLDNYHNYQSIQIAVHVNNNISGYVNSSGKTLKSMNLKSMNYTDFWEKTSKYNFLN